MEYSSRNHPRIRSARVKLEAGEPYRIRVEFWDLNSDATMQFLWSYSDPDVGNDALEVARRADAVVLMMGLSPRLEGEEMRVDVPGFEGGDRLDLKLPQPQEDLIRAIGSLGKPVVLVLLNGSALAVNWADEHIPAIVEAWYPGQAAGTAIADVLFGDYNPAGRLPVTFYKSIEQLPAFTDYTMTGLEASVPVPVRSLQGFRRILLRPGRSTTVTFTLKPRQISLINQGYERVVEPGVFEVNVGGKQPGFSGNADAPTTGVVTGRFEVTGQVFTVAVSHK